MKEEPASRRRAQDLWDHQSRWNARVAIYDTEEVRDPKGGEEAFWRTGESDARRLSWFFAPGGRVLDLGCGVGRVLRFLAPRAKEVIGVDISSEMLARAKRYLSGVKNARLIHTAGATLKDVTSGAVDFFYSLLCLIHVDRRSAYRYFEEIARVLRPGGLAFLQFQNIASEAGLAKFRAILDQDYPLEFYTEVELRYLLKSVGLDVVTFFAEAEFFYFTVINGDAAAWRAGIAAGVRSEGLETDRSGGLKVALRSELPHVQPLRLELSIAGRDRMLRADGGVLDLPPGLSRLEVLRAGPGADPRRCSTDARSSCIPRSRPRGAPQARSSSMPRSYRQASSTPRSSGSPSPASTAPGARASRPRRRAWRARRPGPRSSPSGTRSP